MTRREDPGVGFDGDDPTGFSAAWRFHYKIADLPVPS